MTETDELLHYGTPRKSGRYPWGSGENPFQSSASFLGYVDDMRSKGMSNSEIHKSLGLSSTQFRAQLSMATEEHRAALISQVLRMKDKQMSNVAIANRLGIPESSVRNYLRPSATERTNITKSIASQIQKELDQGKVIDVGVGVENHLGVTQTRLKTAIAMLEMQGYKHHKFSVEQLGTGNKTTMSVMAPADVNYNDLVRNPDMVQNLMSYSDDKGRTFNSLKEPQPIALDRVAVRYGPDGGALEDGVIYIRPGVKDISLDNARYAQVRIAVDGTHYLKGMAIYSNDIPEGYDILFNTNKPAHPSGDTRAVMKPVEEDPLNPFGSTYRQKTYIDTDGKQKLSSLNIVNEEGAWQDWSKRVSSQMLSKQRPKLVQDQLNLTYEIRKDEFDEIMALENPTIKKKLLDTFADSADSSAVHLKAAAMPRSSNHVILPINSLKDNEIYAPNYNNGEEVVLIRHPHGGIFEIPRLKVNNRHPEAKAVLGQARDAVGINSTVAHQLSGADFDGDTVLVIPTKTRRIVSKSPLEGLKDFDPQTSYPGYEGMKRMTNTQREMGDISNLITDMTIRGANDAEIARAVRHSMVVIDAEKHGLNYKQSYEDNAIAALKTEYQGGPRRGAATLISQASSDMRVPERRAARVGEGGPVDPNTGELRYVETGRTYTDRRGNIQEYKTKTTRMAEARDANTLSSGTPVERVYADYANSMKALANEARRESLRTPPLQRNPEAAKRYSKEVATLTSSLNEALKNAPLERQAQVQANAEVRQIRASNPDMDRDDIKDSKNRALVQARARVGASKSQIKISDREWEAIQAGAISNTRLSQILNNADLDRVKELATPRTTTGMSSAKTARAKAMVAQGYTLAEIASALGISTSTISKALN